MGKIVKTDGKAKANEESRKSLSIDEVLSAPAMTGTKEIEIGLIKPFRNHPFKVLDDEKMDELVDSIVSKGVITPVIVRPMGDGMYEMISGHRRLAVRGSTQRGRGCRKKEKFF